VAGVTFSDSDSVTVPKFLIPGPQPGPAIFQFANPTLVQIPATIINPTLIFPCFYWPHRLLLLPKFWSNSGSGSGFSQIVDSGFGSGS